MSVTESVVSTTLRLSGVEAYVAGLVQAGNALKSLDGQKAKVSIDDGDTKAKIAGITQETQKIAKANIKAKVDVDASAAKASLAGLNQEIDKLRDIGWLTGELAAIGFGLAKMVQPAADVQQNLKDIQILSGATAGEISKLDAASRTFTGMGQGATSATSAMVELARAGVSAADSTDAARASLALATAGQVDAATAANALTDTVHAFNLSMSDSGRVADLYAGAANASSATTGQLIQSMSQGGQAANAMGQSLEDTLATFALFADRGLKGSDAGTSFRTMMLRLIPTSQQAKDTMQQLGLQFQDAGGKILPIGQIAEQLRTKLQGLTEAERTHALQLIFGTDAFRAANILYQQGAAGLDKYRSALGQTTAEQVATERTKTLQGSIQKLNAEWENTRVEFGNALIPGMTAVANGLTGINKVVQAMPEGVMQVTADLVAMAAALKAIAVIGNIGTALSGGQGLGMLLAGSKKGGALKVAADAEVTAGSIETAGFMAAIRSKVGKLDLGQIAVTATLAITAAQIAQQVDQWMISGDVKNLTEKYYQQFKNDISHVGPYQDGADYTDTFTKLVQRERDRLAAMQKENSNVPPGFPRGLEVPGGARTPGFSDTEIQAQTALIARLDEEAKQLASTPLGPAAPSDPGVLQQQAVDMEKVKAAAKDAQDALTEYGKAADDAASALDKVDATAGLQGITKALPDLKAARDTLASFGADTGNLDNLIRMGAALANIDSNLKSASGAFNGFNAQFGATEQSIGVLDDFQKKAKQVFEAAQTAAKGGAATDDQLALLKQYPAILDNTNAMIEKLRANQAGDILGMAKNLPNLIEYDKRLRGLVQQYGGPAGLQIEIQLEVNEGLAKQKIDNVLAGLGGQGPLAKTIEIAVQGDADAVSGVKKLRGEIDGLPTQKEIKAIADVLGIKDLQELSLLIAGIQSKTVNIVAHTSVSGEGAIPGVGGAPGVGIIPGYASGTGGAAPGWAWVGDKPGDYSHAELVKFHGGETVIPHAQAMAMASGTTRGYYYGTSIRGLMGLPGYYEPTDPGAGAGDIGTIDTTVPGAVRGRYGGPGTGVSLVEPAKVNAGTAAVKEQTQAIVQEAEKLIDASTAAHALASEIAHMSADDVKAVTNAFTQMNDYLQKSATNALTKSGNSTADAAAQLAATKGAAQGAVQYAVAFAQALSDARNPANDLSGDFQRIRDTGGPLAESAIRWLSVQREINIETQHIADIQARVKDAAAAHEEQVRKTNAAIADQQRLMQQEQDKETAAATARERGHTRESYQTSKARTEAQQKYDADTRARQAYEEGLQRQWAAEAQQDADAKQRRDRAWTEKQRQEEDSVSGENAAWTVEQRNLQDRQTALQRYGTDRNKQLAEEKKALDDLHKSQVGNLGAQEQLLGAAVAGSTDSASRLALSTQLATSKSLHQTIDDLYQQALDANQTAADAETERASKAAADLQDEITKETRAHEDRLQHLADEATAASRKHDDDEARLQSDEDAAARTHAATLQRLQDEDATRETNHQLDLGRQAVKDAADAMSYQEETWRIEDENKRKLKGYSDAILTLQEQQALDDEKYRKASEADQKELDTANKRLTALQAEQGYLDSVMSLWNTLYQVAGDTANEILTILQGQPPIGSVPGHAYGGTGIGVFTAGEHGKEWIATSDRVSVIPNFAVMAAEAQGKGATGGTTVLQPTFVLNGLTHAEIRRSVNAQLDAFLAQYGPEAAHTLMGMR